MMDVFILSSPLQALNAVEARAALGSEEAAAVIVEGRYAQSNAQIRAALDGTAWDRVMTVGLRRTPLGSRYESVRETVASLRRYSVGRLFLGHHFDLALHLANSVPHRETFLLDDGVATIAVSLRRAGGPDIRDNTPAWKWCARRFLLRVRDRMRLRDVNPLHYFTVYDGLPADAANIMHRNTLDQLRGRKRRVGSSGETWFLGMGSEAIFRSRERYLAYLREIRRSDPGASFRYVPHRNEPPELLEAVRTQSGMTPLAMDVPVELHLVRQAQTPRTVASFISSALYTVGALFPSEIDVISYQMDFRDVRTRYHRQFSDIYGYYRRTPFIQTIAVQP